MQGLTSLDHAVLASYLILVVAMGAAFAKGQRSTEDYFLAGRSMPWLPVGISIFASLFSAISLLGSLGWVYDHDVTLGLALVTIPIVTPVVVWVILPFFHRLKVFTAYEYLELRFSPPVRLASGVLLRATAMGALVGALVGFAVVASIVTWTSASFLWYAPAGCVVTFLLGYGLSCLSPPASLERLKGLVVWSPSAEDSVLSSDDRAVTVRERDPIG